jgi:hypothetical protein
MVPLCIRKQETYSLWIVAQLPQRRITAATKQSSHFPRCMVMIDVQILDLLRPGIKSRFYLTTSCAGSSLSHEKSVIGFSGQVVKSSNILESLCLPIIRRLMPFS